MNISDLPARNSVRVGALYHKPAVVTDLIGNSVRLVAHEHRYEGESTIGIGGSCTLLSFDRRAFVVTTRHQLGIPRGVSPADDNFEAVRFQTSEAGHLKNIPVDSCFFESTNPDQEYHDLLCFGVQRDWLENSSDRSYFFPIEPFSHETRLISYLYGHPMSRNEVRHDPLEMDIRTAVIDGELDKSFQSGAEYLRRFRYPRTEYEVNGFSGGAVFSLLGTLETELRIVFDGIIVRGGSGNMLVVDADFLIAMLSKHSS